MKSLDLQRLPALVSPHAFAYCTSVLLDLDAQQLVAATLATPARASLQALIANLVTNTGGEGLHLETQAPDQYKRLRHPLRPAGRGYTRLAARIADPALRLVVESVLHPLAGDPRNRPMIKGLPADVIYVTATGSESLAAKLAERLNLALPWAMPEVWVGPLLRLAAEAGLLKGLTAYVPLLPRPLATEGEDARRPDYATGVARSRTQADYEAPSPADFKAGLRVQLDAPRWRELIGTALRTGLISTQQVTA